jgi:metallophosphoesterase (TIGR00282 family)
MNVKVLFLGDVVGAPGREAISQKLAAFKVDNSIDIVIANGENASGGLGLSPESALELRRAGVDLITLGDHTYQRKEIGDFLNEHSSWCIRPANYPSGAPGRGWLVYKFKEITILLANLMGRTFMNGQLDCPFQIYERDIKQNKADAVISIVDFHAEATSEKMAFARSVDGEVSLVVGTHTHVQTADNQILEKGTLYITDLGMTGFLGGVIGMKSETAIARFKSGLPHSYKIAEGDGVLSGIIAVFDGVSGMGISIDRVLF